MLGLLSLYLFDEKHSAKTKLKLKLHMGKYKDNILHLRAEGKKYKEIVEILGCTMSLVSYHLTYGSLLKKKREDKRRE